MGGPSSGRAGGGRRFLVILLLLVPLLLCGWQTLRWVTWDGTARSQGGASGAYCPPNFETRSQLPEGTPCPQVNLHRVLEPLPWIIGGLLYLALLGFAAVRLRRLQRRAPTAAALMALLMLVALGGLAIPADSEAARKTTASEARR